MDDALVAVDSRDSQPGGPQRLVQRFNQLPNSRKILIIIAAAAIVAGVAIAVLWSRDPGYKILYANVSDKEGGAIIQALQTMNMPYKYEVGGAISVPADKVYDIRLRLASQGLPKGGAVGFELLDNQKFGISQFGEQVNYQRAVEGELSRSIESLSAVGAARVHLAFPKQTVFLREQQKPTASVLLTLNAGRTLDLAQVAGIVNLVSSSVPDLPVRNVSVIDQDGNLLSAQQENAASTQQKQTQRQLAYTRQIEQDLSERIQKILEPIIGKDNVKAEVTAQMDFSEAEIASDTYATNTPPNGATVVSEQSLKRTGTDGAQPSGVPGALSNQPPGAATAPLTLPNPPGAAVISGNGTSTTESATKNYIPSRELKHVKPQTGVVKRISVAVVVNFKRVQQKDGGVKSVALTQPEMNQINNLVREAMGYSKERGDSLNVVNAAFADRILEVEGKSLVEKFTDYFVSHTADLIKMLLITLVLIYLLFGVVRPILRDVIRPKQEQRAAQSGEEGAVALTAEELAQSEVEAEVVAEAEANAHLHAFSELMQRAKEMAREDPRMVATIIREWLVADGADKKAN